MFLSRFAQEGFLNTARGIAFAAPSRVFARLFLTSPGETGTEGIEISYPGHTGMPIVFAPPTIEGMGIGIRNIEEVTFAQSSVDVGTARHIGIYDSSTGGNMYLYGELTEDLPILAGESPVLLLNEVLFFAIGDLSRAYKIHLFNVIRGISLPGFSPYYALYNGNPQDGGGELLGENYTRVPLTFSAPTVEPSGMSIIHNTMRTEFPRPTTNWGNWTHTAIIDNRTAGEPVWIQQRPVAKMLNRGIMPFVEAGAVILGVN